MRRLDYDAVRAEARTRAGEIRAALADLPRRDQPHDEEQWRMIIELDRHRFARWLATGKLRILGPRRFALR
mgnify:CR=1 FL=1